jgi:hypothetical protein
MRRLFWLIILPVSILHLSFCTPEAMETQRMKPWRQQEVREALAGVGRFQPYPGYELREDWKRLRSNPRLADGFSLTIARAEKFSGEPLPALSLTQYQEAQRSGNHESHERVLNRRADYLGTLALAECLEGRGRFLAALSDAVWSFCEESDWSLPANSPGVIDMENYTIDLRSTTVGAELAVIDFVFGSSLDPSLRQRVRYELERRLFKPYLESADFPWLGARNNLNAVCNGSILRAALLAVDDQERLAQIITKAQGSLCLFLEGFGEDGGTAEGLGYWQYGFARHYVAAAQLLKIYSEGRLDLLSAPIIREIALLPLRMELSPGRYANFSDSVEQHRIAPSLLFFLAQSLQIPELERFAEARSTERVWIGNLESLFQFLQASAPSRKEDFRHDPSCFLPNTQWMLSRANPLDPLGLVVAARGGSNQEPHNHNDVGSLIVHYRGESLVAELGPAIYERDYFSNKRYSFLAARSLGHSVPLVNGLEQIAGPGTVAASSFESSPDLDRLAVDMKNAYPAGIGIETLTRTVTLHRGESAGWVELEDDARFAALPASFEGALITFAEVSRPAPGEVRLQGSTGSIRVIYDPEQVRVEITEYDTAQERLRVSSETTVVRRLAFQLRKPSTEIRLRLKILPD